MSNPLRLYPEDLRATASALGGLSSDTDQVQQRLDSSWGRLDSGWEWYAEEDITGYFQRASRELNLMAAMLEQMGQALVKTADLIEAADQAAVALFELSMTSGATDGKGSPGLKSPAWTNIASAAALGSFIVPANVPTASRDESGPGDWIEQLWNWFFRGEWKTDEELATGNVTPVEPAAPVATPLPTHVPAQPIAPTATPTPIPPTAVPRPSEMYVSSPEGLNVRLTPGTSPSNTILIHILDHTKLQVNTDVTPVQADDHEWYKVTYTDLSGNVLIGWVAQDLLTATQPQEGVSQPPPVWPSLPSLKLGNPFGGGNFVIINPYGAEGRGGTSDLGDGIQRHNGIDIVPAQWADASDAILPKEVRPDHEVYAPVSGTIVWYDSDKYTVGIHDIPGHPGLEVQITHVFGQVDENGTVKKVDLKVGDQVMQGDFLSYYGFIGDTDYPHVHVTFKQYDNANYTGSYHFLDPSSSLP